MVHLLSTIRLELRGFGKTPRPDPLILSQQDDCRARPIALKGADEMRNAGLRVVRKRVQMLSSETGSDETDAVKNTVRNALLLMSWAEQVEFIKALETEMRRENLSISHYLIPLGIPGMKAEELTPTEVGHLVRFLKMHVRAAMPALERAMARLEVFRQYENSYQPLAA
jgi:hypothetical protein